MCHSDLNKSLCALVPICLAHTAPQHTPQVQHFQAIPPTHHIWGGSTPSLLIWSHSTPTNKLITDNQEPIAAMTHHIGTQTHPDSQAQRSSTSPSSCIYY